MPINDDDEDDDENCRRLVRECMRGMAQVAKEKNAKIRQWVSNPREHSRGPVKNLVKTKLLNLIIKQLMVVIID